MRSPPDQTEERILADIRNLSGVLKHGRRELVGAEIRGAVSQPHLRNFSVVAIDRCYHSFVPAEVFHVGDEPIVLDGTVCFHVGPVLKDHPVADFEPESAIKILDEIDDRLGDPDVRALKENRTVAVVHAFVLYS